MMPKISFPEAIFSRGLLIVCALILPQLIVLLIGFSVGKSQDEVLQKAKNAFWFSVQINKTASAQLIAYGHQTLFVLLGKEADGKKAEYFKNLATEALAKIRNDPQRDWTKAALYTDFERQAEQRFQQFFEMKSVDEYSNVLNTKGQLRAFRRFANLTLNRDAIFQRGISQQVEAVAAALDETITFRTNLNYVIIACVLLNFAIAAYLAQQFSRRIVAKLKMLMENAALLCKRKELRTKLEGTDELAYVDKVFHKVSQDLIAAEEFRNNLLAMVAHDMCSPLAAVSLSLTVFGAAEADKLTSRAKEEMENTTRNVDMLVSHAREILDVQKLAATEQSSDIGNENGIAGTEKLRELSKLIRMESALLSEAAKSQQNFKPTLVAKSLCLFIAPLVVSLFFLSFLLYANTEALKSFAVEKQQSTAALDINKVIAADFTSSSFLVRYLMYGNIEDKENFFRVHDVESKATQGLRRYSFDGLLNDQFLSALKKLEFAQEKELALGKSAVTAGLAEGQLPSLSSIRTFTGALRCMVQKQASLIEITDLQSAAYQGLSQSDAARQQARFNLVVLGVVADLIVAVLAAFIFSQNITARLKTVKENAARLSNNDPLNPALKGNDEVCYLDAIIHQSKATLDRNLRQRMLLMETVAEDLREPLDRIATGLEYVDANVTEAFSEKGKRHFSSARSNVSRILVLIDTLIASENLNTHTLSIEKKTFIAGKAISKAIESVGALAASRQLALSCEEADVSVNADFNRIVQALVNYLTNAINHTPEGGAIVLSATIMPGTVSSDAVVKFAVSDTGQGLSPESREKVFERFYQTSDSMSKKKGYGMGLAICKMIAEAHGGRVGVDEALSGGCSFYIEVPAH